MSPAERWLGHACGWLGIALLFVHHAEFPQAREALENARECLAVSQEYADAL